MAAPKLRTGLAVVGGCAAVSIVLPPLAGLLNLVGSLTLLALVAYGGYRAWAWMEAVVEASRRPTTVRRNLRESESPEPQRGQARGRNGPPKGQDRAETERELSLRRRPPRTPERVGGPEP